MRESTTYQAILEEGRQEGRLETLRANLLHLAEVRFGKVAPGPSPFDAIGDGDRLQRMMDRILTAVDWYDLLSTP